MSTIINQAVIMLLLIMVGFVCFKTKIISEQGRKDISSLVLTIVNPVVIVMAYQKDFEARLLKGLLTALILSVISYAISIAVSYLLVRKGHSKDVDVERFSCIYSNCGFMGIPLVNAVYGSEGVFYLTAFLTVFNLLVWTHGAIQMSGVKSHNSLKKALLSPAVIAIAVGLITFVLRIKFPTILYSSLDFIGSMNTPLAMITAGASIAQTNLLRAIKKKRTYFIALIKLIIIPAILLLVFRPFGIAENIMMTVILAMAAPSAAICTLFCIKYDKNTDYASEIFAVTTILSVATLPLVMLFK